MERKAAGTAAEAGQAPQARSLPFGLHNRGPRGRILRAYLDASALVKTFVGDESDRRELESLFARDPETMTSRSTFVECHAALSRALRGGQIDGRGHRKAEAMLRRLWDSLQVIELDSGLAESAAAMAKRHELRAADAIHLAAALTVRTGPDFIFACWDRRLRAAAIAEGFHVLPEH
ncbi:MAG: type II toxin-antitoxin system VapC family toxin [Actinomycetota bacterium]